MTSTFRTRNPYYLRITPDIVLPLYVCAVAIWSNLVNRSQEEHIQVYLDDRHLDWMSDNWLQLVLQDIRPNVLPKLKAEAEARQNSALSAKKLTVDTKRGEGYQFCYFLRKTEPHSVLIKKRVFSAAPPNNKRKLAQQKKHSKQKKQRTRGQEDDSESDNGESSPDEIELEIEEEEEKPKPIMSMKYKGFNIYNHSLCIVLEPYPPLEPSKLRAASTAPSTTRAPSIAPPDYRQSGPSSGMRAKTPLFLPDDDDDDDDTLPINPFARTLPPVPLFNESPAAVQSVHKDDGPYGMMELSQVLSSAGDLRSGAVEEEEEEDNAVFFADADEVREFR